MLSISNISVGQAATYYEKDNYYTQQMGEWYGKGKKILKLDDLTHESFQNLIRGKDMYGNQIIYQNPANTNQRAGVDLTFTAPKSLSVLLELAEAYKDKKLSKTLQEAHNRAVNTTLNHIENNYIQARIQKNGIREKVTTGNMVVAKFQHDTSRELDPNLHTHCVIMNMTQTDDGNFKALSNELLFIHKIVNGLYYRSELARNLKELDFDIKITNTKQGLFELKGIDQILINEFSTRKKQIDQNINTQRDKYPKASEAELRQYAALQSRKSKKDVDREQIRKENLQRAENLVNIRDLLVSIDNQEIQNIGQSDIDGLTKQSSKIITEQESTFAKEEVMKTAAKLKLGTCRASEIFDQIEKSKHLIQLEQNLFTTPEMIQIEHDIIEFETKSRSIQVPLENNSNNLHSYIELKYSTLTSGQRNSLIHILQSKNQLIGIQGDAGTGKTFMLKALHDYTDQNHIELIGMAFTGKAAAEIEDQSGIASHTLHSFLQKNVESSSKQRIYIVDEASLIGSKQLHKLIKKAIIEKAKIVLIGDTKQFQSISAGAIFDQLQQHGMKTVQMSETLRQKTAILKAAVNAIKVKDTDKAFEILKKSNSLVQTSDIVMDTVTSYLKSNKNTLVIASKNLTRIKINESIREYKKKKKSISECMDITIRESSNLIGSEKFFIQNYQVGQIVFANKNSHGLKAGAEGEISKIDKISNKITLRYSRSNDTTYEKVLDISRFGDHISTYNQHKKEFGLNEKIMFTKNDKKLEVKNGQTATITSIDKYMNITAKIDNREIHFNITEYAYLDHGYATTDYKAQGATAEHVIISADAELATSNSFYVQVTRAKSSVQILTDDIEILQNKVKTSQKKSTTLSYKPRKESQQQNQGLYL